MFVVKYNPSVPYPNSRGHRLTLAFFAVVLQVYLMMRSVAAQREFAQRTWLTVLVRAKAACAVLASADSVP